MLENKKREVDPFLFLSNSYNKTSLITAPTKCNVISRVLSLFIMNNNQLQDDLTPNLAFYLLNIKDDNFKILIINGDFTIIIKNLSDKIFL